MLGKTENNPEKPDELDKLIHEPTRLKLIAQLYVLESADFVFLQNRLLLTQGNLSSHMNKLEEAGYVLVEKTFVKKKPRTLFSLTTKGRTAFENYRDNIHKMLDADP
ncbi:transcriptional regulator [bacterium]|nr:transcriptional regulator [bacterium]